IGSADVANICGSALYYDGEEALYTFTPATTADYVVSIEGNATNTIMVYEGCPLTGTCMGNSQSGSSSGSVTVSLTSGVEYFIMFDVWSTPNSPCPSTFSLEEMVPLEAPCTNEGFG